MNEEKKAPKMRSFLAPGYVKEIERGLYGIFREVQTEEQGIRKTLGEPLGPLGKPLREAEKGEEHLVVLRSWHPKENRPLELVEAE